MAHPAFASCAGGLEALLAEELAALGAEDPAAAAGGVSFRAGGETLARILLWSRLASRVLLTLAELEAEDGETLYASAFALPWTEILPPGGSFRVHGHGRAGGIRHSGFAALRVKDAILDRFRAAGKEKPVPAPEGAAFPLDLRLDGRRALLSLDLAGEALHRRGWRVASGTAPLKETLAAAMLLRAGWPALARTGGCLLDPMCGSGTLLIEGGMIAADLAPGIARRFAGERWPGIPAAVWGALRREAEERRRAGLAALRSPLLGFDLDPEAVAATRANAARAGLPIRVEQRALAALAPDPGSPAGLIVCNPPYGERILPPARLAPLYVELGERLAAFAGFQAMLLAHEERLLRLTGLRAKRTWSARNGPLACLMAHFEKLSTPPPSAGWEMLANRLRKRSAHLKRAARRAGTDAFRVYDADLPEYAAIIDRYGEDLHLAEYRPPPEIPPPVALRRLRELLIACRETLGVPLARMHLKERFPQSPREQYRASGQGREQVVCEDGLRFLVDLDRYADTGLFLDHREVRRRIRAEARGKRFLDLFCYTGTATVAALAGGAREAVAVDLSRTYLAWVGRNLALNGLAGRRVRLVYGEVRAFLARTEDRFDLIHLDPPSFSNSKRAPDFVLAREWLPLLEATAALLSPGGVLWFSHHLDRFEPDLSALAAAGFAVEDWTARLRAFDFGPTASHRCWRIARPGSGPLPPAG
jgi:23S rRNA (guanine2445-N2)-methyltransferase / 23S rRNA (guanine2069-N7)-methyltransferase